MSRPAPDARTPPAPADTAHAPASASGTFGCRVIDARDLTPGHALRWDSIQAADPDLASPYFCSAFTRLVASVRDDVRVALIERGGEPAGFFPFQRGRFGEGRPVGGPLSDYQGVIAPRGGGWSATDLVAAAGLGSYEFDHMIAAQSEFAPHASVTSESPTMDLSMGYDAYAEARRAAGSKQINGLGTLRRKFEREVKPLRFELHSTDPRVLGQLLAWKSEQCRSSGGVDIFEVAWTNDLAQRLIHTKDGAFEGVLSALWAGDELLAAHLGMRSRTVWHYWFPSYNHEYSKFSPGLLLLLEMARTAESIGIRTIDLGRGEAPYKDRMKSGAVPLLEGRIELPSLATRLRRMRDGAERWLKASPLAAVARYPGRALKRLERRRRFR